MRRAYCDSEPTLGAGSRFGMGMGCEVITRVSGQNVSLESSRENTCDHTSLEFGLDLFTGVGKGDGGSV